MVVKYKAKGGNNYVKSAMETVSSPREDSPLNLEDLPPELIIGILKALCVYDLGRTCMTSLTLLAHAEQTLRQQSRSTSKLPESGSFQLLAWRERRLAQTLVHGAVIAGGHMHSAFADSDGRLLTCGTDVEAHGFLGHGEDVERILTPLTLPLFHERVVSVSAHAMHTLALTADGVIYSFGHGGCGKLGHGDEQQQWQAGPRRIDSLAEERVVVVAIATGQQHNLALSQEGRVYSFGSGFGGKLGHGDRRNQPLPKMIDLQVGGRMSAVAAGAYHSLVVAEDGAVFSFGYGVMGQLGHGDREERLAPVPIAALAAERIISAAGGENHTLVVSDSGAAFSFGAGGAGRLGHGPDVGHGIMEELLLPKRIDAFCGMRVLAVAAGAEHSLALVDGGAVFTFGAGTSGKLGHGDARFQWLPTRVAALHGETVVAIAAGNSHSLCALRDGRVFGWGSGGLGLGLQPAEHPSTTFDHPPATVGSAGNQFVPAASLLSRQTLLPVLLEHHDAATEDARPSDSEWPAWPDERGGWTGCV